MRLYIFVLLCIVQFNLTASPIPDFPFVTVTGESDKEVRPDKAKLRLSVTVFEKESAQAELLMNQTTTKILTILLSNQVDDSEITAHEISKRTKRAREKNGYQELEILGYEFSRYYEVNLSDLSHYQAITEALQATDNIAHIESKFDSHQREQVELELLSLAAQNARNKAKQMAQGLGVKLGSVFAVNDTGSFESFFATFGLQSDNSKYAAAMMRDGSGPASRLFAPKFIKISKSVNVVYKLKTDL